MPRRSRGARRAPRPATLAVHAGSGPDRATGSLAPPLHLTSTYRRAGLDDPSPYDYGRTVNPTRTALEASLADLEGGGRGFAFASGMAAIAAVTDLVAPGERLVATRLVYGGTYRLFEGAVRARGIDVVWADGTDSAAFAAALRDGARLAWVETPSNPTLRLTDLRAVARAARRAGAWLAVDNTFATPLGQRPLDLGADLAVHSTTKYLNGHSDGVGGAVVVRDDELARRLAWTQNAVGAILGPLDAYLVLRGIRTLAVRLERQRDSAARIARRLARHARVRAVHYPGLTTHPDHALARRQMTGFGAVVTVDLGTRAAARRLVSRLRWFTLAESLGGVESLVAHPVSMSHHAVPPAVRRAAGITPGLLRLSVGVEDPRDLIEDLLYALD